MTETIAAPHETARPGKTRGGYLRFVALLVLAVLAFRSFAFSPFTIPSESMLPRLAKGDYLVASKWPYGWSRWSLPFDAPLIAGTIFPRLPERGDIAIFRHPITHAEYIKRVIGLPGDTVAIRGGVVVLDGTPLARERMADFTVPKSPEGPCAWGAVRESAGTGQCRYPQWRETLPGGRSYRVLDFGATPQDDFGPVTVPAGHVFLLGDNRDNSLDSRFPSRVGGGIGMVPVGLLIGRFETVLFSTAAWPEWLGGGSRRGSIAS